MPIYIGINPSILNYKLDVIIFLLLQNKVSVVTFINN